MISRPMALLTAVYVSGILAGYYFAPVSGICLYAAAALTLIAAYILKAKTGRLVWFVILPFFVIGIVSISVQKAPDLFDELNGENATIYGIVTDVFITDYGRHFITVKPSGVISNGVSHNYKKRIIVRADIPFEVSCGQYLSAEGELEKFNFKRNPGGYSEYMYMRTRGVGGRLLAESVKIGGINKNAGYYSNKAAQHTKKAFAEMLPKEMAGLMDAIILGIKTEVPNDISDSFRKTGVSHVLAISGLHLSLIAVIVYEFFRFTGLRINASSAATVVAMWVYCFFTGSSVSTVRAVLMITLLMLGYIIKRGTDAYSALSLAAFVILMKQPLFLWDAGFLLSFSAVFGIFFLTPLIRTLLLPLDFGDVKISSYMAGTISATLFTMPVSAYFFFTVSIAGLLVNILIVPFVSLLVGAGFAFMLFNSFFVSGILASVIFTILQYFIVVTRFFASLPFSTVTTGQPSIHSIILYYLLIVLTSLHIKHEKKIKWFKYACVSTAGLLAVLGVYKLLPENKLEIVFLDVGQGDASVLHLPGGIDMVIDGGGNILAEIGENTGITTVIPYLEYKGKTQLDAVFLTHPDMDHAAGVIELMDNFKVNRLFIPDVKMNDEILDLVLNTAKKNGIPVSKIKSGYTTELYDVRIDCIYPYNSEMPGNINNSSLTMRITHGDNTFLFTGDIEKEDEKKIVLRENDIKSDVLKVPHHGSNTSSTPEFVKAVSPELAIVGTAKNNVYGHPTAETLKVYADEGVLFLNTADEGAVILKSEGKTIDVSTMKEEAEGWTN